jgi:hypothetical protein
LRRRSRAYAPLTILASLAPAAGGRSLGGGKRRGPKLPARALMERNAVLLDLALDLLVPPLTWIILLDAGGLVGAAWLAIASGAAKLSLLPWSTSVFFLRQRTSFGGGGVDRHWTPGLLDLFCSPIYVIWKVVLLLKRSERSRDEWILPGKRKDCGIAPAKEAALGSRGDGTDANKGRPAG